MALFTNRVFDPTASAFVRWNTASPDTGGGSYPGPDAFGNTSDFIVESVTDAGGVTDHGALLGLADDDHLQYALLLGRAGGQSLIGGTGVSDTLTLRSSSNGAPGDHDILINDNLDLQTFDITGVGDYAGATGSLTGLWAFADGITAGKTTAGSAIGATAAEGDEVAVINLTSTTGVGGTNNAATTVHVGDRDPNSNVDANEGVLYVRVGVGTSTLYIKDTASGTLTGWTDLGAAGTPAGADTQIQFNNSGAFGASANLIWDGSVLDVVGSTRSTIQLNVTSTVTTAALSGTTAGGEANPVVLLDTSGGTDGSSTSIHVGTENPNGSLTATTGALYVRSDTVTPGNSTLYVNVNSGTTWADLRTGGSGSVLTFTALQTSLYTAASFDIVKVDPSGGAFTVNFPASPATDDLVRYVNTTTSMNTVTLDGNGNNINGASTKAMSDSEQFATFGFDGTEWFQV